MDPIIDDLPYSKGDEVSILVNGLSAAAYDAAAECLEKTKEMQAQRGRTAYYQEKTIGKPDPGGTVGLYIMQGFKESSSRRGDAHCDPHRPHFSDYERPHASVPGFDDRLSGDAQTLSLFVEALSHPGRKVDVYPFELLLRPTGRLGLGMLGDLLARRHRHAFRNHPATDRQSAKGKPRRWCQNCSPQRCRSA